MNKKFAKVLICFFSVVMIVTLFCHFYVSNSNKYYCADGYDLIGDTCVKEEIIEATYEVNYYCNNSSYNEKLVGNNCIYYVETPALTSSNCPIYYTAYGSRCRFIFGSHSSRCNYDEVQWGNKCYKEYINGSSNYYCTIGKLVGTKCIQEYSYKAYEDYEYSCSYGYKLIGSLCKKTIYKNPEEKKRDLM